MLVSVISDTFDMAGVVLHELVEYGAEPYFAMDNESIMMKVASGYRLPQPQNCPDKLYSIMTRCWAEKHTARPSFKVSVLFLTFLYVVSNVW